MYNLFSSKCFADMCLLSNNIYDYVNVSQGKITIPNVDDGEECTLTDVSPKNDSISPYITSFYSSIFVTVFFPLFIYIYISLSFYPFLRSSG